jgi:hypothetical protein
MGRFIFLPEIILDSLSNSLYAVLRKFRSKAFPELGKRRIFLSMRAGGFFYAQARQGLAS